MTYEEYIKELKELYKLAVSRHEFQNALNIAQVMRYETKEKERKA